MSLTLGVAIPGVGSGEGLSPPPSPEFQLIVMVLIINDLPPDSVFNVRTISPDSGVSDSTTYSRLFVFAKEIFSPSACPPTVAFTVLKFAVFADITNVIFLIPPV